MVVDFNEDISLRELADRLVFMSLEEALMMFKKNTLTIPFFSVDPKEEAKEVKKMKKAIKLVLDYYSIGGVYEAKK